MAYQEIDYFDDGNILLINKISTIKQDDDFTDKAKSVQ